MYVLPGRSCGQHERCAFSSGPPELLGGLPVLAEARLHQLRRAGGPDRHHAPGAGGAAALDLRAPLPARPELLHVAARPRGPAARHLHRLVVTSDLGRHRGGDAVRPALARDPHRSDLYLRHVRRCRVGARGVLGHQAGGRGRGPLRRLAHRLARAREPGPVGPRGGLVPRHLRLGRALSLYRAGGGHPGLHGRPPGPGQVPRGRGTGGIGPGLRPGPHR